MSATGGRRRDPRVAVSLPAQLGARQAHAATLVDLSASGCLARCQRRLAAGQVLDLGFELDGLALRAKVRVAEVSVDGDAAGGSSGFLVGLEFLGLPPEEARRVMAWVAAQRRAGRGGVRA